jgi:acetoacetyl-CoA reductase
MNEYKNVLVTGAMGGLGTEICKVLHSSGYKVYATCRPGKEAEFEIWKDTNGLDASVQSVKVDLSDKLAAQQSVIKLIENVNINYLVNNAGIVRDSSFSKMTASHWEDVISCNLGSIFYVTQPIYNIMYAGNFGRIINISSINGLKGQFGQTNYSAAKAGMIGFTKSLAIESARKDITVNAIAPGYIDTPMLSNLDTGVREQIISTIPKKRLGTPLEIAKLVQFLFSDDAGYITGETISINGGQYMS